MSERTAASPDEDFVHDYLAYLLARASDQISSEFHNQIRDAGLSFMEWRVMASLSPAKTLSIGALANIVLAQQPTVTKLVARMAEQGWIHRSNGTEDKRQALVSLTTKGRRTAAPLLALAKAHEAKTLAALAPGDAQRLKAVLRQLIATSNVGISGISRSLNG